MRIGTWGYWQLNKTWIWINEKKKSFLIADLCVCNSHISWFWLKRLQGTQYFLLLNAIMHNEFLIIHLGEKEYKFTFSFWKISTRPLINNLKHYFRLSMHFTDGVSHLRKFYARFALNCLFFFSCFFSLTSFLEVWKIVADSVSTCFSVSSQYS